MGCEKRTSEKDGQVCPKKYRDADCTATRNYNVLSHSARRAISGLFRFQYARLSFSHARHRLRTQKRELFLLSRRTDGENFQDGKKCGFSTRIHNLYRLDADCQRYGALDLSAPWISRFDEYTKRKVHDFHVRHAEYRGEPRRDADPLRQSAKPVPLLQIQYSHARIYGNYGDPLYPFRALDYGVLSGFRQKRTARVRGRNRQARTKTNGSLSDFICPFRHYGVSRRALLDRAADYLNHSLNCGLESGCKGGLSASLHVCVLLYLRGQYGAYRTRAELLFVFIRHRHPAVQRALLPGHQQRAVGNSLVAIYK